MPTAGWEFERGRPVVCLSRREHRSERSERGAQRVRAHEREGAFENAFEDDSLVRTLVSEQYHEKVSKEL